MNLLMNWIQREKYINTLTGQDEEEKIGKLNGKEFGRGDGTQKIEEIGRYLRKIEDIWRYLRKMEEIGSCLRKRKMFTENRGDWKIFTEKEEIKR